MTKIDDMREEFEVAYSTGESIIDAHSLAIRTDGDGVTVGTKDFEEWKWQQDNSILRAETAWQTIERAFYAGQKATHSDWQKVMGALEKVVRIMNYDFKHLIEFGEDYNQCARDMTDTAREALAICQKHVGDILSKKPKCPKGQHDFRVGDTYNYCNNCEEFY